MKNFEYLKYTYLHRRALHFTILKLVKDDSLKIVLLNRAKYHDLDKSLLYTLIEKKAASAYHRAHARRHMENSNVKTNEDFVEAVNHDKLLETTHKLGIDRSYKVHPDKDWNEYISKFLPVTEEAIMQEIYTYCVERPNDASEVVKCARSILK